MNWKLTGIIFGVIAFLVIFGAAGYKIIQKTEGYKAQTQNFYTFEPHQTFFGCANYRLEASKISKEIEKRPGNRTLTNTTNAIR